MEPITISIADAAKALSIGKTSLYRIISEGRLKTVRILGRQLVTVESLKALVGEQSE